MEYKAAAKMIDHSLLNPTLSYKDLLEGVQIARIYDVASVCIIPVFVKEAVGMLKESDVLVGTTIGFPHGVNTTQTKVDEVRCAIADGAVELDMVVNISMVLSEQWGYVSEDIKAVTEYAHSSGAKVKVIFENCYLNKIHKIKLCEICSDLNVDWVKTSTGYGTGGALDEDLKLMRLHSADNIQIKAAGGVRTLERLTEVKELGCTRVGATATVDILEELRQKQGLKPLSDLGKTASVQTY